MKMRACMFTMHSIFMRKSCGRVLKSVYNPSSNKLIYKEYSTHEYPLCFLSDTVYTQPRGYARCLAGNGFKEIDSLRRALSALPACHAHSSPAFGDGYAQVAGGAEGI